MEIQSIYFRYIERRSLGINRYLSIGGGITANASFLEKLLVPEVINEMSGVGGLLIMALGINMMDIKKIRGGNMLPSLFLPIAYYVLKHIL